MDGDRLLSKLDYEYLHSFGLDLMLYLHKELLLSSTMINLPFERMPEILIKGSSVQWRIMGPVEYRRI
jgi:hypothetical protein